MPLSRFNQEVAFRFHSQSRIKLQTPQILKKMLEKSSPFLSSEQPCELKILDIALNIAGVKKNTLNTGGHLIWVLNERSISDGGNLHLLWLEILESV